MRPSKSANALRAKGVRRTSVEGCPSSASLASDAVHRYSPFQYVSRSAYARRTPLSYVVSTLDAASLSPASLAISAGACSGIGITELTLISQST